MSISFSTFTFDFPYKFQLLEDSFLCARRDVQFCCQFFRRCLRVLLNEALDNSLVLLQTDIMGFQTDIHGIYWVGWTRLAVIMWHGGLQFNCSNIY